METAKDLERSARSELIVPILETLHRIERSIKSHKLLLARYFKIIDQPRLEWSGSQMMFEFEFEGAYDRDSLFTTHLELQLDPNPNLASRDEFGFTKSPIKKYVSTCSCFESKTEVCPHTAALVTFLRQKLSGVDSQAALTFLESLMCDGRTIGAKLVESISQLQAAAPTEEEAETRVQWRITTDRYTLGYQESFGIVAYAQQLRKRGGWSKGRRVREVFETLHDDHFQHPNDRILATMLDMASNGIISSGVGLREALRLLAGHPNVAFDDEYLTPANIIEQPIELRMEYDGELYRPALWMGEDRIDAQTSGLELYELNSKMYLAVVIQIPRRTIWFSQMNQQMFKVLKNFRAAARRKATLDQQSAEQLADLIAQPATKPIQLNLPEALAGPEQPLDAAIEVHLTPTLSGNGLHVGLRVACDASSDPPVPGMEPQKIRIATPAGRFQLVRNLELEEQRAQETAKLLELDQLTRDGLFTWLAETDDLALTLIERLQDLGESCPPVCWPKSRTMRLVGEITPQRLQVKLSSQRDWFGMEGFASLDGLEIPLAELLAALRTGRRFVPLGNGQFATISEQLRHRLTAIYDVAHSENGQLRIAKAATPIVEESLGDDIAYESDAKWQEALARLNEIRQFKPEPPAGLKAELREYQKHGFQWLTQLSQWGLGGCLADDMGLGKTVQALGVLLERGPQGPALIVAPTSVGVNWQREAQRFSPQLSPKLYREHDRQHLIETAGPNDLIITSYQLLQRDVDRFASRQWHTLVLDEAQFIKNYQTKTARAVRSVESDWCLALSGTPMENHLGELWSLMRTISPGLLGSWERFRKQFAEPIEKDRDVDRLRALSRVVRPFILRRTKKEVLTELPPRTEIVRIAEFSDAERKKYDAARLAALSELSSSDGNENEQQKRIRVLAWLTRLRQLACHPRLVDPRWTFSSAKLDLFMEIVEELREGEHRALVFSQFVQHLSLVREALDQAGIRYQYLDGSTPTHRRQEAVDSFQGGDGDLFLISLKAGGTGLNLTAADYVIHLDPWWNPAVEDQATDRAHRIGQERAVTVYRLVAKDTIEEQILSLHDDKRELIAGVLDGADRAGKLSTDELVRLIRMSQVNAQG
ncbi:MAG: DEAD/DEAH box helicase [Pirellulales bacterium]